MDRGQRGVSHGENVTDSYEVYMGPSNIIHQSKHGHLHKAKHLRTGTFRAVRRAQKSSTDLMFWNSENKILMDCDHPNICRLYETFQGGDWLCRVVELCAGKSLAKFLPVERMKVPENVAAYLVRQAMSAVGHLHQRKVCHMELTPSDFFMSKVFPGTSMPIQHLCLKLITTGCTAAPVDVERVVIKKDSYSMQALSPEQVDCGKDSDYASVRTDRSDVYSLGCIAFWVITNAWPLVSTAGIKCPDTISQQAWSNVSSAAQYFVQRCCALVPSKRQTCAELLEENPWMMQAHEAFLAAVNEEQEQLKHTKTIGGPPILTMEAVVQGFGNMARMSKLERAALTLATYRLPEEKTAHIRQVFFRLDTSGSGTLTFREIADGLGKAMEGFKDEEELREVLLTINTDGSEEIDYLEFLTALLASRQDLRDDVVQTVFDHFDSDHSGIVTFEELRNIFGLASGDEMMTELKARDVNGDGKMDIEEFKNLLTGGGQSEGLQRHARRKQTRENTMTKKAAAASPRASPRQGASPRASPRSGSPKAESGRPKTKDSLAEAAKAGNSLAVPGTGEEPAMGRTQSKSSKAGEEPAMGRTQSKSSKAGEEPPMGKTRSHRSRSPRADEGPPMGKTKSHRGKAAAADEAFNTQQSAFDTKQSAAGSDGSDSRHHSKHREASPRGHGRKAGGRSDSKTSTAAPSSRECSPHGHEKSRSPSG